MPCLLLNSASKQKKTYFKTQLPDPIKSFSAVGPCTIFQTSFSCFYRKNNLEAKYIFFNLFLNTSVLPNARPFILLWLVSWTPAHVLPDLALSVLMLVFTHGCIIWP